VKDFKIYVKDFKIYVKASSQLDACLLGGQILDVWRCKAAKCGGLGASLLSPTFVQVV